MFPEPGRSERAAQPKFGAKVREYVANKATARARALLGACPITAPLLAVRELKEQVAEGRNGGDSAVLRVLELSEAIYRLRALPPEAGIKPFALGNEHKPRES